MKVLAINGSSRKNGNTSNILNIVLEEINKQGIETELLEIGNQKIQCFQALQQYTYSVLFHALHIVFYQTDNFVVHAFPALLAVME